MSPRPARSFPLVFLTSFELLLGVLPFLLVSALQSLTARIVTVQHHMPHFLRQFISHSCVRLQRRIPWGLSVLRQFSHTFKVMLHDFANFWVQRVAPGRLRMILAFLTDGSSYLAFVNAGSPAFVAS